MNIKLLKNKAEDHLLEKFGIVPEKSKILLYKTPEWDAFCSKSGFPEGVLGMYSCLSYSAHIHEDSRFFPLNFFHEYFGHGLWTEYTDYGQEKTRLEEKVSRERPGLKNLENSKTYWELKLLHEATMPQNEGFATWMEHYLSALTGYEKLFLKLIDKMPKDRKDFYQNYKDYEQSYGEHALLYSAGFPKHYNTAIIEDILKKLFKEDFKSIELALLYGSKKPRSDIDVFIVSDKIQDTFLNWIDIKSVDPKTLTDMISHLDISVTEPLFTGELICGNKSYLGQLKETALKMPITEKAVTYNIHQAEHARKVAITNDGDLSKYQTAMGWNRSYFANARLLINGKKTLTRKGLEQ